jgi:CubicO group peptidase (beta-lactamase class C family)
MSVYAVELLGILIALGLLAAMAAAANAFMEEYDVPGLSVAVARNGSLAYA